MQGGISILQKEITNVQRGGIKTKLQRNLVLIK